MPSLTAVYEAAKEINKIKFNSEPVKWTKSEFRKKVVREKESKTINISQGGSSAVMAQLKQYASLITEKYDRLGLIAHGQATEDHVPTGDITLAGETVPTSDVEKMVNSVGNTLNKGSKLIWVSCYRDQQHKEQAQIVAADGDFRGSMLNGQYTDCQMNFYTTKLIRKRSPEPFGEVSDKPLVNVEE